MLSHDDNEFLTRVGPGTPMGNLLREFWFPVLPSCEVPAAGARPMRMRLLGEPLVLFRNTEGKIGLISEFCPHRRASLYFGRNEDGGLRCVYHGWLMSTDGRCLELPNEPIAESMRPKIRHRAYPCREINGTVWTYMGSRAELPAMPNYGLATMPADQKAVRLSIRDCNWMQAVEGDLDLSHGGYLHSAIDPKLFKENHLDRHLGEVPHFDAIDTEFGVTHCVRRTWDDNHYHLGIAHFLFPFLTTFPAVGDRMEINPGHAWIPMDDRTTLVWAYFWHPSTSVNNVPGDRALGSNTNGGAFDPSWEAYLPETSEAGSRWRQRGCSENDYGYDEEAQRTKRFSGIATVGLQDRGLQESMGPVVDRSQEHLGVSDSAVIRVRRRLMAAAKKLRDEGTAPECLERPDAFSVRAATGVLRKDVNWMDGVRDWTRDAVGVPIHSRGHLRPGATEELKRKYAVSA
jgi:phenylpropionate dioxygenase-like ring-hydroxylating dioxygenase large terminal subunit